MSFNNNQSLEKQYSSIKKRGNSAKKKVKLFIGGVDIRMGVNKIKQFFMKFGPIFELHLESQPNEKFHFGYGYLITSPKTAKKIKYSKPLTIKNRKIDVKIFLSGFKKKKNEQTMSKKTIYVSNLPKNFTDSEFKNYLRQYGRIKNAYILIDKETGLKSTEGIVIFTRINDARKIMKETLRIKNNLLKVSKKVRKKSEKHFNLSIIPLPQGLDTLKKRSLNENKDNTEIIKSAINSSSQKKNSHQSEQFPVDSQRVSDKNLHSSKLVVLHSNSQWMNCQVSNLLYKLESRTIKLQMNTTNIQPDWLKPTVGHFRSHFDHSQANLKFNKKTPFFPTEEKGKLFKR